MTEQNDQPTPPRGMCTSVLHLDDFAMFVDEKGNPVPPNGFVEASLLPHQLVWGQKNELKPGNVFENNMNPVPPTNICVIKHRQLGKSITSGMLHEKMHLDEQQRLGLITQEQYNEMIQAVATAYGVDIDEPKQEPPTS